MLTLIAGSLSEKTGKGEKANSTLIVAPLSSELKAPDSRKAFHGKFLLDASSLQLETSDSEVSQTRD
jgi:hypothetical protein